MDGRPHAAILNIGRAEILAGGPTPRNWEHPRCCARVDASSRYYASPRWTTTIYGASRTRRRPGEGVRPHGHARIQGVRPVLASDSCACGVVERSRLPTYVKH